MSGMRYLTNEEINFVTKDIKGKKSEVKNILRTKIKVYKLSKAELNKLKKTFEKLFKEKNIPRYLTEKEVEYLVEDLPEIPSCISHVREFNREKIINHLKFDLMTFKMCTDKESLTSIKNKIYEVYVRSLCQPGDSVGSNGAMALGQTMTQATLDAFHTAGSANSKEEEMRNIDMLLYPNTKKATSSSIVHFRDKNLTKEEILRSYNKKFKGINVKELIVSTEIMEEVPAEDKEWYNNYFAVYNRKINTSNNFMRLKINVYKCYVYGIQIRDICNIIEKTTRNSNGKKTLNCVTSSTYHGVIDIHVEEKFISETVQEFITKGSTFKVCEKRYRGKTIATEEGEQKTYLKTILDMDTKLEDLISIFLKVILETCFKDMSISGIQGIENIVINDLKLSSFLRFRKVFDDKEIMKYTTGDYPVNTDDFYRLYYVYIDYYAINITGVPPEKFIKYLELCGMTFVEDHTDSSFKPYCVFLLPEVPDSLIKETDVDSIEDENRKKAVEKMVGENRFEKQDDVIYDRLNDKQVVTPEEPMQLITRKFKEAEDSLKEMVLSSDEVTQIDEFPEIYRYGNYCYIKVYGKNIIGKLLRENSVDPYFTSSNSVNDIMTYYGIEASRLFFVREYTSNGEIQKMNPVNIELLVDFQTAMGQILSVTSTDIAKHGNSALVSASFEQPLEAFKKTSSMGNVDIINNIPSCLITGKRCINGTGIVSMEFDDEYKNDPGNKIDVEKKKTISSEDVDQREILGNCFGSGKYVEDSPEQDESKEEREALEATQTMENVPSSDRKISKRAMSLLKKNQEEIEELDIPDINIEAGDEDESLLDL